MKPFVIILSASVTSLIYPVQSAHGSEVVSWGGNNAGQTTACATNVAAIAAGYEHNLLLKADGTVTACGKYFELGNEYSTTVPDELSNVVAVAAGDAHSVALKSDGTVAVWGRNQYGQTNLPAGLFDAATISAGSTHTLVLKRDGTVVGWGLNANVPEGLSNIIAVSAGRGNSVVLKADGTVYGWGFGHNKTPDFRALSNIVQVAAGDRGQGSANGYNTLLALRADGIVLQAGYSGQVDIVQSNAVAIAGSLGTDHHLDLLLRTNGTVIGWGFNFFGGPNVPPGLSNVVAIAAGSGHQLALVGGGKPFVTESPAGRMVGMGSVTRFRVTATGATPLSYQWTLHGTNLPGATQATLTITNIDSSHAGPYAAKVSNNEGAVTSKEGLLTVVPILFTSQPENQQTFKYGRANIQASVQGQSLEFQWLKNGDKIPGATTNPLTFNQALMSDMGDYALIASNSLNVITSAPARLTVMPVAAWGSFLIPVPVELTNAIGLASGSVYGVGLKNDGTVKVWGGNPYGTATTPDGISNIVAVAAWGSHNLALKEDGTLTLWGATNFGLSTVTSDMTNIVAIAAGVDHSVALKADGTVMVWGSNGNQQKNVPAGLSNVVAISAGAYSSLALKDDGTVLVWGGLSSGQPPIGMSYLQAADWGGGHSLGLKPNGTVIAWGNNFSGQTNVPAGLSNAVAVSAGQNHNLALLKTGNVITWGDNASGQCNVPQGLTNVIAIYGGNSDSMALIGDAPLAQQVVISTPTRTSTNFSVSLPTQSGRVYRLEYKDTPEDPQWKALPLVAGNGGMQTLTDSGVTSNQRLYRVRQW